MSQSPQRRKPTSQSPARTMNVRHDNRRSSGLVIPPQGLRGHLPLLAVLLALAMLVLVPAVVFAAAPTGAPTGVSATTGDGTMTLSWNTLSGASGGYDFRYSDTYADLLTPPGPTWNDVPGTNNDANTSVTLPFGNPEEHKLAVGTPYYFQVRGKDSSNNAGPASEIFQQTQRAAPAKLSGVTATAGNREVTLAWTNPNDFAITHYDYRQSTDGGENWGGWQNLITGSNSHTVTGLSNGTTYSFQVRANSLIGSGEASDTVTATPSGPPAAPDLRADPGDGKVRLYWANLNDATITKFQYRKRITDRAPITWDPDWGDISGSDASTKEHTVSSLTNGTGYTFEARAINDDGEGDSASIAATPTVADTTPNQMSNVQHVVTNVNNGVGGTVEFTWDDPGDDQLDNYEYRFKCHNAQGSCDNTFTTETWNDVSGSGSTTSHSMSIPGNSATVYFQLRGVNDGADDSGTADINEGAGPVTAVTVSRTNSAGTSVEPPAAPGSLTATPGVGQVILNWTTPTIPTGTLITKYQYRQSTDGGTNWAPVWADIPSSDAATKEHTVSGLTDGTTYTFEVLAFHDNKTTDDTGDDQAGAAAQAAAATPGAPNAPATLSAAGGDKQVTLTWTDGADNGVTVTGFQYRQRASGDAN